MEHFKFWHIYLLKVCKHLLLIASSTEKAIWVVWQEWKYWERRPQGRKKCCFFPLNFWSVSIRRLCCVWRYFPRTSLYLHRVKHCNWRYDSTSGASSRLCWACWWEQLKKDTAVTVDKMTTLSSSSVSASRATRAKTLLVSLKASQSFTLKRFHPKESTLASSHSEEQGWHQDCTAEVVLPIISPNCTYLCWCQRANRPSLPQLTSCEASYPNTHPGIGSSSRQERDNLLGAEACPALTASYREDIYSWLHLSHLRRG